jgi:hypothetical protein
MSCFGFMPFKLVDTREALCIGTAWDVAFEHTLMQLPMRPSSRFS